MMRELGTCHSYRFEEILMIGNFVAVILRIALDPVALASNPGEVTLFKTDS
jgi:hypothetical protein